MIVSICISILLVCIYIYFFPFIPKQKKHYTYALLLGCPAHDDGTMSSSQIKRCNLAIDMYKKGLYGTLIISGSNVKNEYVEAEVMNTYIRKRVEIPTILETHARIPLKTSSYLKNIFKSKMCSFWHPKRTPKELVQLPSNSFQIMAVPGLKI